MGRGVGDEGGDSDVLGCMENDEGSTVRRDARKLLVEFEGKTDDLVRVL